MNRKQRRAAARAGGNGSVPPPMAPEVAGDFQQAQAAHLTGRLAEAETLYRRVLETDPGNAPALHLLGVVACQVGNLDLAEQLIGRAITLQPDCADAHNNLAGVLLDRGQLGRAKAALKRAIELSPAMAEAHAQPLAARIRPHGNDHDPDRRLRIGYVSADFRNHSAAHAFGPVVLGFDPDQFEITCYASVKFSDETTDRFRSGVGQWRDVAKLSDADLAEQVRSDGIDILVDLSGHTDGHRLLAFAEAPAPVQVTAWGHGTGTGLEAMDYLLSDPVLVPPAESGLFAEEIYHLPSNFLYEPPAALPPVTALPAETTGHVTFGCLNRREKISSQSIELWSKILNCVSGSRLLIKARELSDDTVRTGLRDELVAHGIAEDRLVLMGHTSRVDHLDAHNRIDIALDPFPQSGGISTADALWMGVPVVTLRGRTVSGRNAASILTVMGMEEFIAETADSYRDIAIAAARDFGRLGEIRSGLRRKAERFTPRRCQGIRPGGGGGLSPYVAAQVRHLPARRECRGIKHGSGL